MMNGERIPNQVSELESFLHRSENAVEGVYPQARAQIVWGSESGRRTRYSLVYLHGFRATHQEGDPVHLHIARHRSWNCFLARHAGHGLQRSLPLQCLKAEDLLKSARNAIEIGLRLGDRVILMGTSTGASMALWLAGQPEYRDRIGMLVLYSPLIDFHGVASLLRRSIPRTILRYIPGPGYPLVSDPGSSRESRIWYSRYALQGPLALGTFIQRHVTRHHFRKVHQPVFTGYYENDRVVSVSAILKMVARLGTPPDQRVTRNFPGAGSHVICSGILSQTVREVERETLRFLEDRLD